MTEAERARTLRAPREAEAELETARQAERQRLRRAFDARKRELARRLDAALKAAAAVHDEWAALIEQEGALLGVAPVDLLWPALLAETAQQARRITTWRRTLVSAGLLTHE